MSDCTINGFPIQEARIARPRVGAWTGEIAVDVTDASNLAAGAQVSVSLDGGALVMAGTVLPGRSDAYAQQVTLRVIGGRNGLSKLVTPRFYAQVNLDHPLGDVLSDAGESLSGSSSPSALGTQLPFWSMVQQPASEALSSLADAVGNGCVWRVLADGSVFFGVDQFPQSGQQQFELIDYMPLEGVQVIATEDPQVNPGENFSGKNVSAVEHLVDAESIRLKIFFETAQ